jgi:acyl transferase domain-containing protein/acyl carrier protein
MSGSKFEISAVIHHDNYIMRDHRVHGVRILPGVVFLDMIYRFAGKHLGKTDLQIENILYHSPVVTSEEHDQRVYVCFENKSETSWKVTVSGQKIKGDVILDQQRVRHAECSLTSPRTAPSRPTLDIDAFIEQAEKVWDMDDVYSMVRSVEIAHGEFMKALGKMYHKGNAALAVLQLSELAEGVRDRFIAHPVFLDASTSLQFSFRLNEPEEQRKDVTPYIPFSVRRFCVYSPLPAKVYVYSEKFEADPDGPNPPDLVHTDIRIFDETGNLLAVFEKVTGKRIRQPELIKGLVNSEEGKVQVNDTPISASKNNNLTNPRPEKTDVKTPVRKKTGSQEVSKEAIRRYMQEQTAALLEKHTSEIQHDVPFYDLGLDSGYLLRLTKILESHCGHEFYPTFLFEYKTISEVSDYLYENDKEHFEVFTDDYEEANGESVAGPLKEEPAVKSRPEEKKITYPVSGHKPEKKSIQSDLKQYIREYLQEQIASVLGKTAPQIHTDVPFYDIGLDSTYLLKLTKTLEQHCGHEFYPTFLFEYKTIREVSEYLYENDRQHFAGQAEDIEEEETDFAEETSVAESGEGYENNYNKTQQPGIRSNVQPLRPASPAEGNGDIAVIGMAGRYPGARNLNELWNILRTGKNAITEVPEDHWNSESSFGTGRFDPENPKSCSKWGGFIEDADKFDPMFFDISPREAEGLDPQLRQMLEVSWHAVEDAGYTPRDFADKKVGVFVGVMNDDYTWIAAEHLANTGKYESTGSYANELANRVSYHLNLQGPSMAIEAACASSLTAIHQARRAIMTGDCEMALAGGINLSVHRSKYLMLSMVGVISPDGKEKTFDKNANGYVPGEGVGIVVLKRLDKALEDGDQIYGVIRGSAVSHSGRGSGKFVPDAGSLMRVVQESIRESGIHPDAIEYLETHGTGTSLGDPIEVQALSNAFKSFTDRSGFCALGSKANIGHLESASGICSLTKVLLSLKHGEIPPCSNVSEINPGLRIEKTPFYIPVKSSKWEQSPDNRVAGIHSFGVGGSNGFLVVQGFDTKREERKNPSGQEIVILSAKTEASLKQYASGLVAYLEAERDRSFSLAAMAYTLQTGREAMPFRLAVTGKNEVSLLEKLKLYLEGKSSSGLYSGIVHAQKQSTGRETFAGEEGKAFIHALIRNKNWQRIAYLWTEGVDIPWKLCHQGQDVYKISLPVYPFARERYWIGGAEMLDNSFTGIHGGKILHPLLHENTSSLLEHRYTSVFTGNEFFIRGYNIAGTRAIPDAACLEMARAAAVKALGLLPEEKGLRLEDISWTDSLRISASPSTIHIGLFPGGNGEILYDIYTGADDKQTVYHQGVASLVPVESVPSVNLKTILSENNLRHFSASSTYQILADMGVAVAPSMQGIEEIWAGTDQALIKLSLPGSATAAGAQPEIFPGLTDSVVQAAAALLAGVTRPVRFSRLDQLDVYGKAEKNLFAWVRQTNGTSPDLQSFDIDFTDEEGLVRVSMKGLSVLPVPEESWDSTISDRRLLLHPVWKKQALTLQATEAEPVYSKHLVFLAASGKWAEDLQTLDSGIEVVVLGSKASDPGKRFSESAVGAFEKIRNLLQDKLKGNVLVQLVVPEDIRNYIYTGLSGLLKTARNENPKLAVQTLLVDNNIKADTLMALLNENSRSVRDAIVRYHRGEREVLAWQEETSATPPAAPWKENGVYLITGGAGGLGFIFAGDIVRKAKKARIILTGRSPLSPEKQELIEKLGNQGTSVEYLQADISRPGETESLIKNIVNKYGTINGILHSAGIIRDNYIVRKSREDFSGVLEPKVAGTVHLDHAASSVNLDFFALFSSASGVLGNPGQSDYAAGNAFMDAFAYYRNNLVLEGERHGHTLSVDWPLWKEGGMKVDQATEAMVKELAGMIPMSTATGLSAFYEGIASVHSQIMVMEGEKERLRDYISKEIILTKPEPSAEKPKMKPVQDFHKAITAQPAEEGFKEKVIRYFQKELAAVFRIPADRMDADMSLENYGIDSVIIMQLTGRLEKTFGSLSKTLFFEYQSIRDLAGYFQKSYEDKLRALLDSNKAKTQPESGISSGKLSAGVQYQNEAASGSRRKREVREHLNRAGRNNRNCDIAITGISGRYPQAYDINEFWNNLSLGKDCITEVPQSRWDWNLYFTEDRNKDGHHYSKSGGFMEDVDKFDAKFFNISPREAEIMDPQERLFLEHAWMAMEDAGYRREDLRRENNGEYLSGQVGVYAGVMYSEYQLFGAEASLRGTRMGFANSTSTIANRVSYILDLHGPSMTVDSMCSGSLSAIHLACQDLKSGRTSLALAGGVNVSIHPNKYLMLSMAQFISPKGRCESFGEDGDGYIPGEGVGVLVLKRLEDAERDGDHIYGIIKGSAVNHGGKTNGYTVPNPRAQQMVIQQVLSESGIDPRTISYVEAHGTGTKLGDPIEITGLTKAFGAFTADRQFCHLGSVKSNIGHCESAAGISGITKVLLQLRHRKIVPSLHSRTLNPNIDFESTPFIVNQELREWEAPVVAGKSLPRRAGISSFGAGGSNAHIIIEEYVSRASVKAEPEEGPFLFVLSARTRERLEAYAGKILRFVREEVIPGGTVSLADFTYTLQAGREAMEERMGMVVNSWEELEERLQNITDGKEDADVYFGQPRREKEAISWITSDEEMPGIIAAWISKGKYDKLLELWVKGFALDWSQLYRVSTPHRISIPTYPFARQRFWITDSLQHEKENPEHSQLLHPMLHANTSDFSELRFSSVFTGNEFFLKDSLADEEKILPDTAQLEMAAAAVRMAAGAAVSEDDQISLKDIVWAEPVCINGQPRAIHIAVIPEDSGEIVFEIYSHQENGADNEKETVVHGQGVALIGKWSKPSALDLSRLSLQCRKAEIPAEQINQAFHTCGIRYGSSYQVTGKIFTGEGQSIARISIPESIRNTLKDFTLHPSLMQAAIQVSATLSGKEGKSPAAIQPVGLGELKIYGKCTPDMWVWTRYSNSWEEPILDIDFTDEEGNIVVTMKNLEVQEAGAPDAPDPGTGTVASLVTRPESGETKTEISLAGRSGEVWDGVTFIPRWEEQPGVLPVKPAAVHQRVLIVYQDTTSGLAKTIRNYYAKNAASPEIVLLRLGDSTGRLSGNEWLCGVQDENGFMACLEEYPSIDGIYFLGFTEKETATELAVLAESTERNEIQLLRLIKCMKQKTAPHAFVDFYVLTLDNYLLETGPANPYGGGITGLTYAIAQGDHRFRVRNLDISSRDLDDSDSQKALLNIILNEPHSDRGDVVKLKAGARYKQSLFKMEWGQWAAASGIEKRGVYVILGGSGTVGGIITHFLMQKYEAHVIWIGRKQEGSEAVRERMSSFEGLGGTLTYIEADSTDAQSLRSAVEKIKSKHFRINGAIFSGMVFSIDNSIAQTTEAAFYQILDVKVKGSVNFYSAFKNEPLDFMCYFSSGQAFSFSGAAKLSAYATGITFSDAFIRSLQTISAFPVGTINWGFWKSSVEKSPMRQLSALEDEKGFECFESFTGALKNNVLNQALCLNASEPVQELMNIRRNEIISLGAADPRSIIPVLKKNYQAGEEEMQKLAANAKLGEFNKWMGRLLFVQLRSLDVWEKNQTPEETAGWRKKAGIIDLYERWWKESVRMIEEAGYIEKAGGMVRIAGEATPESHSKVWQEWEVQKMDFFSDNELGAQAKLADACLRNLPEILKGTLPATDILFPDSSMEVVEGIYKNSSHSDFFNTVMADAVEAYVQQRIAADPQARIRLIEIGAGTGGTTASVLPRLRAFQSHIAEYCYTDLSRAFLIHAQQHYLPGNPFLTCKLWDVEKPMVNQGIGKGTFDIVIAANVLHATRNIRQTMRNAKAALRQNGLLLLNEIAGNSLFAHLTFGLLKGWWLYEDPTLRIPGSPGLYPEGWKKVLEEEGFHSIKFPVQKAHVVGQQIVMACSNGVIRQQEKTKNGTAQPADKSRVETAAAIINN